MSDLSLNQHFANELLRIVSGCSAQEQPSKEVLDALRESIRETTKLGAFEALEVRVEQLTAQVRDLRMQDGLRNQRARV